MWSHQSPCRSSVPRIVSVAPRTHRGPSRSSMRSSHRPAFARACTKLATAVSSEPRCRGPVGDGAKRPISIDRLACSRSAVELALLDLIERLAVDALRRGRTRFEASQTDLDTAGIAVAVVFLIDPFDRLVDLLDQLAFAVAGAQLDAELFLLRRAISRIRKIRRFVLHVMYGAIDLFHQLLAPLQQNVAEMVELLGVHVSFAALGLVRDEVLERRIDGRRLSSRLRRGF